MNSQFFLVIQPSNHILQGNYTIPQFGKTPIRMICPICNSTIITRIAKQPGTISYIAAIFLCFLYVFFVVTLSLCFSFFPSPSLSLSLFLSLSPSFTHILKYIQTFKNQIAPRKKFNLLNTVI